MRGPGGCFPRYTTLSFALVGLAGDLVGLNILTNGLVLPLVAATIRTTGLTFALPSTQRAMARAGHSQPEIDESLGNIALAYEVVLALPAIVLLMRNPSLEATLSSAFTLLGLEVAGKHAYLGYIRLRHEGDRAGLRKTLDMLEIRLVYEEVGEKLCILVSPLLAYYLDRGKEDRARGGQLVVASLCIFGMEELVDSLLLILMVKHGVNALRVKPAFSLRVALILSGYIAAMFGALQIADRLTYAADVDDDTASANANNSTAVV